MVRRGLVRGCVHGVEQILDPAGVYVERPGSEQQFAHPCGEDVYTEMILSELQLVTLLGGDPAVPEGLVFTTPELTVAHRLLLTRAHAGDDAFEVGERAVVLAADLLAQLATRRVTAGRPRSAAARRKLADDARAALGADVKLGLNCLARAVGCSACHLSRVFREETGITLTLYRHRIRLAHALERLAEGERDLALLAHDLNYSDQSHLTHALRRARGLTPGRLRTLLHRGTRTR